MVPKARHLLFELLDAVNASWKLVEIDRGTILSLYQSAVSKETEYWKIRLSYVLQSSPLRVILAAGNQ